MEDKYFICKYNSKNSPQIKYQLISFYDNYNLLYILNNYEMKITNITFAPNKQVIDDWITIIKEIHFADVNIIWYKFYKENELPVQFLGLFSPDEEVVKLTAFLLDLENLKLEDI